MAPCLDEGAAPSRLHPQFALEFHTVITLLQRIAERLDPGRCACCDASVRAGVEARRAALDTRAGAGARLDAGPI